MSKQSDNRGGALAVKTVEGMSTGVGASKKESTLRGGKGTDMNAAGSTAGGTVKESAVKNGYGK